MKLIIGLGNPDKKYRNTRHNVGHLFVETFGKMSLPSDIKLGTNDSYMNESGDSVQKLVHFYKVPLDRFYLVHDDLDLPVGEYRLQFDRGAAGHHGVESVVEHLGSQAFWRIRIGIGRPPENVPVEDYVLQPFSADEKVLISQTIDKITTELLGH
jgi:peptidyl-tRNA hydrolase, PTH1 family